MRPSWPTAEGDHAAAGTEHAEMRAKAKALQGSFALDPPLILPRGPDWFSGPAECA